MLEVRLAEVLLQRGVSLEELGRRTGISAQNLWVLKAGRARAIRFSTLDQICKVLACTPGDLLQYCAPVPPAGPAPGAKRTMPLEAHHQLVLDALEQGPIHLEDVIHVTGLLAQQVSVAALQLELAGLARRNDDGLYVRL